MPKRYRRCCVRDCLNTKDKDPPAGLKYHEGKFRKMPEDPVRREEWNNALGLTGTAKLFICSEHFTDDAWRLQDVIMNVPLSQRKLKPNAVPTLFKNGSSTTAPDHIRVKKEKLTNIDEASTSWYVSNETMSEAKRKQLVAEALAAYEGRVLEETEIEVNEEELQLNTTNCGKNNKVSKHKMSKSVEIESDEEMDETEMLDEAEIEELELDEMEMHEKLEMDEAEIPLTTLKRTEKLHNVEVVQTSYSITTDPIEKCGEINVNICDETFTLNCLHCTTTYLDLLTFSAHVKTAHVTLFDTKYLQAENEEYTAAEVYLQENEKEERYEKDEKLEEEVDEEEDDDENEDEYGEDEKSQIFAFDDISDLLKNRPLIKKMIKHMKKQPIIWQKSPPWYEHAEKRTLSINELLEEIWNKFPHMKETFTNELLSAVLQKIRLAYFVEQRQHKKAKANNYVYQSKYWFCELLKFLDEPQDTEKEVNEEKLELYKCIATEAPYNVIDEDEEAIIMHLIERYEQTESLWNMQHQEYKGKVKNKIALKEMLQWLLENYPQTKIQYRKQLQEQLHKLNRWFGAEEKLRFQTTVIEQNSHYESNFPQLYKRLEFLRGHVPPFPCTLCEEVFQSEEAYKKHIHSKTTTCAARQHKSLEQHACEYCGKVFAKISNLRQHIPLHTNEKSYECKICNKRFFTYSACFRHRYSHTNEKPFKCDLCDRSYHINYLLQIHRQSHLGIRDKLCDFCGKAFFNAAHLQRHRNIHLGLSFKCKDCDRVFKTKSYLSAHRPTCTHDAVESGNHLCDICGKGFKSVHKLELHRANNCSCDEVLLNHTCDICSKKFKSEKVLQRHRMAHESTPRFKCEMCGRLYRKGRYLRAHQARCHPEEFPSEEKTETQREQPIYTFTDMDAEQQSDEVDSMEYYSIL